MQALPLTTMTASKATTTKMEGAGMKATRNKASFYRQPPTRGQRFQHQKQHQQQQRARSILHGIAGDLNASANDDGDDDKTLQTFKAVTTTAGVDDSETIQP